MRRVATLAVGLAALVAVPAAGAHVTANPSEAPAGSFAVISLRVPHGCEDSPTTSLTVKIPEGSIFVTPQAVPGWTSSVKTATLATPIESEGETVTEGATEVTWTGGPLDPHEFTDFGLSMQLPDKAGETVWFPAIQRCEQGTTRWIKIPVAGQEEPDTPAPGVTLVAATGDEHGDSSTSETETTAAEPADTDDDGNGVAYAALALGAAGLIAGLGALGLVWRRGRTA